MLNLSITFKNRQPQNFLSFKTKKKRKSLNLKPKEREKYEKWEQARKCLRFVLAKQTSFLS